MKDEHKNNELKQGLEQTKQSFADFLHIIQTLRGPNGCPWDKEQTPLSIRGNLLEECYECIDAIDSGKIEDIVEELGDVYLVLTMISYMYEQEEKASISEVLETIKAKLIRRHPHVFSSSQVRNSEEVIEQWERIKTEVEGYANKDSVLDSIPRTLPPLERAYRLQKKAAKTGFDWPSIEGIWAKVMEEIDEVKDAHAELSSQNAQEALEKEIGDLLFSVVNISRFLGIDPAIALHKSNNKFSQRFKNVEKQMTNANKEMNQENMSLMDSFWEETKESEET